MSISTKSLPESYGHHATSIRSVPTHGFITSSVNGPTFSGSQQPSPSDASTDSLSDTAGHTSSTQKVNISSCCPSIGVDFDDANPQQGSEISDNLKDHLAHRLETGLDGTAKLDDPFLQSIRRERTAFIVARKYTNDVTIVQPVTQDMLTQSTPEEQLVVLEKLIHDRDIGASSLWIWLPNTICKNLKASEHRLHRSHAVLQPQFTYVQLLVQQTPNTKTTTETPIYDMVRGPFKPEGSSMETDLMDRSYATMSDANGEFEVVRIGFMSIFIIPRVNVLVTITLPYYDCPASRLAIHTAKMDTIERDQLEISTDATLLGLSLVHRAVGYASGIERINKIREMISTLQDFKKRLKPLDQVHQKLLSQSSRSTFESGPRHSQPDATKRLPESYMSWSIANEMLQQGKERLEEVLEDVDGLVERCTILEDYSFNMMSMRANQSMERLAIVSIVFLPLTFIASLSSDHLSERPELIMLCLCTRVLRGVTPSPSGRQASYFSMGFDDFSDLSRPPIYFPDPQSTSGKYPFPSLSVSSSSSPTPT
ncbi:hypothetical protein I316_05161 [Kwoniella heveanensis BCC8398]|uniref:Magnesium transporter n=1 Tax=Kwoniella heveanensis BCC8398 TaxID=1296120 RepID=A0A1B9GQ33_9TREE|nr:hypothetical protein I316_05161 [Kwoniella heveanensis BCC8398]